MRTSIYPLRVFLIASALCLAPGVASADESAPRPAPSAATKPADQPDPNAIDKFARRLNAHIAWTQPAAQQILLDHVGAQHAHHQALMTLRQCQDCHQGVADRVPVLDPHALAVSKLDSEGPWIGISVGPADDVLRAQLKLPEGGGVVVTQVVQDGPAHKADVREHDILLSVNGQPLADGDTLDAAVKASKADGSALSLKLLREGKPLEKQVVPSREPRQVVSFLSEVIGAKPNYRIGISVSDPDETLRRQLRLNDGGVVVTAVAPGGAAEKQGLKVNDVLLSINAKPLTKGTDLPAIVQAAAESPVELELMRGGARLKVTVTPEKDGEAAASQYLQLRLLEAADQQLTLLRPGVVTGERLGAVPASPAERLNQITSQLDQLRSAVEALRTDLDKAPETKPQR